MSRIDRRPAWALLVAAVLASVGLVSRTLLRRSNTQVHLLNQQPAASSGRDRRKEHG